MTRAERRRRLVRRFSTATAGLWASCAPSLADRDPAVAAQPWPHAGSGDSDRGGGGGGDGGGGGGDGGGGGGDGGGGGAAAVDSNAVRLAMTTASALAPPTLIPW